jgi:predicted glycosyltransferase
MPRVLIYCQSLVGLGHVVRAAALAGALSGEAEVCLLGGWTPGLKLALGSRLRCVPLNPLRLDLTRPVAHPLDFEEDASCLLAVDSQATGADVLERRKETILREIQAFEPQLIFTEYYPLGRWVFGNELLPGIEYARSRGARIVCSVRDILKPLAGCTSWRRRLGEEYEGGFRRYYRRAVDILNGKYDALVVHADPELIRLEESVLCLDALRIPLIYTGYLSAPLNVVLPASGEMPAQPPDSPYAVLSAGGGYGEQDFVLGWLEALRELLPQRLAPDARLYVLAGPLMEEPAFAELRRACTGVPAARLLRYCNGFQALLDGAALSVSRAGYNTAINILRSPVPAVLAPASHVTDQELRAARFDAAGAAIRCAENATPSAQRLATGAALERVQWNRRFNTAGDRLTREFVSGLLQLQETPRHVSRSD